MRSIIYLLLLSLLLLCCADAYEGNRRVKSTKSKKKFRKDSKSNKSNKASASSKKESPTQNKSTSSYTSVQITLVPHAVSDKNTTELIPSASPSSLQNEPTQPKPSLPIPNPIFPSSPPSIVKRSPSTSSPTNDLVPPSISLRPIVEHYVHFIELAKIFVSVVIPMEVRHRRVAEVERVSIEAALQAACKDEFEKEQTFRRCELKVSAASIIAESVGDDFILSLELSGKVYFTSSVEVFAISEQEVNQRMRQLFSMPNPKFLEYLRSQEYGIFSYAPGAETPDNSQEMNNDETHGDSIGVAVSRDESKRNKLLRFALSATFLSLIISFFLIRSNKEHEDGSDLRSEVEESDDSLRLEDFTSPSNGSFEKVWDGSTSFRGVV